MSDPLSRLLGELNKTLGDVGMEEDVVAEVSVRVTVTFGPIEHDTILRCEVGEDGWTLIEPNRQMQRIRREILNQHYSSDG